MTLEEAQQILTDNVKMVETAETKGLLEALGEVLAEDVTAPFDNPPFNRSPLDGYAMRSEDIAGATKESPVLLQIVAEECAGDFYDGAVKAGECIRLMTGAAIPADCDCVIRQEDVTDDGNGQLSVPYPLKHHENFCFKGEDIKKDTLLIKAGTRLTAGHLGVLASMGYDKVKVVRKPNIILASTGDELLQPGEPLALGKIYNSNLFVLAARLKEMGFSAKILGALPDDVAKASEVLKKASKEYKADLILTTGGVSVGKKDIMHGVVANIGEKLFWRVAMKPGAPVLTYRMENSLGIALSGNPFAAYATFELLVRPVLAKLSDNSEINMKSCEAVLADDFPKKSKGRRFIRGRFENGKVYLPSNHGSGSLYSAMECNCFVDIPAGSDELASGARVKVFHI